MKVDESAAFIKSQMNGTASALSKPPGTTESNFNPGNALHQ